MIAGICFETASHRGLTDEYVYAHTPGWLFRQHDMVQAARWSEWTGTISATEIAVTRALAVAFADRKKPAKLPSLPSWREVSQGKPPPKHTQTPFADKIRDANRQAFEEATDASGRGDDTPQDHR